MDLTTEMNEEYYQTSHVLRGVRVRANAAGQILLDRLASFEDIVLQIPFMRTAR